MNPTSALLPMAAAIAGPALAAPRRLLAALLQRLAAPRTAARTLAPSSRAAEALPVRALATRMQSTDPGFAADLFAAAARHESLDDSAQELLPAHQR